MRGAPYIAPRGSSVPDAAAGSTLQTSQLLQQPLVADVESLQSSQRRLQSVDIPLTGENVELELQRIYMTLRSVRNILAWLPATLMLLAAAYSCMAVAVSRPDDKSLWWWFGAVFLAAFSICAPCVSPPCYHKDAQPGASMDDTCERCGAW